MCKFDAVVLGAGAAGLLCAIEAGKRGRRALVPAIELLPVPRPDDVRKVRSAVPMDGAS